MSLNNINKKVYHLKGRYDALQGEGVIQDKIRELFVELLGIMENKLVTEAKDGLFSDNDRMIGRQTFAKVELLTELLTLTKKREQS